MSFKMPKLPPLPPALQEWMDQYAPILKEHTEQIRTQLEPVWDYAVKEAKHFWAKLAEAGITSSVGSTFKHICVVGLNRSELLMAGEAQSVFSDSWQDLADDSIKRN